MHMFLLVCQKIVKKLVTGHFKIKSYVWINNNTNRKSNMIGSSDWLNPIELIVFPQVNLLSLKHIILHLYPCDENLVGSPCKRAVMPNFIITTRKWWCYSFTFLPVLDSRVTAWSAFSTKGRPLIPVTRPFTPTIIKRKGYAHSLIIFLSHTQKHTLYSLSFP